MMISGSISAKSHMYLYSIELNNLFFFVIRDFHLTCRAVVVRPPLELSHSLVQFGATAVGDHSTTIIFLINHETNHNQSKQPINTETKDAMTLVAPRLFSFLPPKDSDISIAPSAGALLPGEVK